MPYDSIRCTYHQLKYSSPNRSSEEEKKRQEPHKRAYLSENGGLVKKTSGEWAKSRKGSDRNSDRTRQKNKRGVIEKWDQTDSPEIPDKGGKTSEMLRPPCGGRHPPTHLFHHHGVERNDVAQ